MTEKRPNLQILAIVPATLLLLSNLLPLLFCLQVSFKNYNLFGGLLISPWIGGENYVQLVATGEYFGALHSTLSQSLPPLVVGALLAALSAAVLPFMHSNTGRAAVFSGALLFAFIPAQLYLQLLRVSGAHWSPTAYRFWIITVCTLPTVGVAVFVGGACACLLGRNAPVLLRQSGTLLYIFNGLVRVLSTNLDSYHLTAGPSNAGMTLLQLEYQKGMLMIDISASATVRMLTNFIQLLPCILAAVLIPILLQRRKAVTEPATKGGPTSPVMWILLLLGVGLFVAGIICCLLSGAMRAELLRSVLVTTGITVLGGCFFLMVGIPAAAASASFRLPVVTALLVCAGGLSGGIAVEFLVGRTVGMVNTVLPPAFWAAMGLTPLAAYMAYFFYLDFQQAIRFSLPILGLALQSILTNLVQPMLYLSNPSIFPLPIYVRYAENAYPGMGAAAMPLLVITILAMALWAAGSAPLFAFARNVNSE